MSKEGEKASLVNRALVSSELEATEKGQSLALIRPVDIKFIWKRKTLDQIDAEKQNFALQAAQLSLLEEEIKDYAPCPFEFKMKYKDASGVHTKTCADWETSAAFFKLRNGYSESQVLEHLRNTYCEMYVSKGIVFALGNLRKRPQTWQLLGIFPAHSTLQGELF